MATRKAVAEMARVSPATVTFVLNKSKKISAPVEERVLHAVETLKYRPNKIAASLATKKSKHLGIVINELNNNEISEIIMAFDEKSHAAGYITSLILVNKDIDEYFHDIIQRQLEGLFVSTVEYNFSKEQIEQLKAGGVSVVTGDLFLDGVQSVRCDFSGGMDKLFKYLKAMGHVKIGYISGLDTASDNNVRFQNYLRCVEKYGMTADKSYIVGTRYPYRTNFEEGRDGVKYLLENTDVTCVMTANGDMAIGAVKYVKSIRMEVPDDISVVACDGGNMCRCIYPEITNIAADHTELGGRIFESLDLLINGKESDESVLPMNLYVGQSVKKIKEIQETEE